MLLTSLQNITEGPKIVDILLCQIEADKSLNIVQVIVQFNTLSEQAYMVFEKCLDVADSKWKIVDTLKESDEYFNLNKSK